MLTAFELIFNVSAGGDTVAKALELFMANIVEAAVKEARETGGKKLTAYHLYVPLSSYNPCPYERTRIS
jgi:hypothetical protein